MSTSIKLTPYQGGLGAVLIKDGNVVIFETDPVKVNGEIVRSGDLKSSISAEDGSNIFTANYEKTYTWQTPLDFDYIGFYVSTGDTLICIPNPYQ